MNERSGKDRTLGEAKGSDSSTQASTDPEKLYRMLVESSLMGICVIQDGVFQFANKRLETITGYSQEELIGKSVMDLIHPEDMALVEEAMAQPDLEISETQSLQFRGVTKTGETLWMETFGPRVEFRGKPALFVNVIDFTERKIVEDHWRFLSSAVEQTSDGIAVTDLDGNVLFVNSAFASIHGYKPDEVIDRHLSIFHTSDQMPFVESANRHLIETGAFSGEIWHVRRDGATFPSLMHNSLLRDEEGAAIGIIATMRDITNRKRMEDLLLKHRDKLEEMVKERTAELTETNRQLEEENKARERTEKALRESEQEYRTLFENAIEGIFTVDLEGNFASCNPAMEKAMGWSAEELIGQSYREHVAPEATDILFQEYNNLFNTGSPIRNLRYETIRKDGERRTVETNVSLISKDGKVIGFQGTTRDITEQVRVEDALQKTLDELEQRVEKRTAELSQANEKLEKEISVRKKINDELRKTNSRLIEAESLKENLVNMIVHDMKNPVTNAALGLEFIESDPEGRLTEQQKESLRIVKRNQFKLSEMIINLLDISKLESGVLQPRSAAFDALDLINRVVDRYGIIAKDEEKTIQVSVDESARHIVSDQWLLERIISNILSNAIKHSCPKSEIIITLSPEHDNRSVSVSIKDFGEGIPEEFHNRVFDKFYQVRLREFGQRTDTGLGLTFCKMAVETLGGDIRVESKPGEGSRFIFNLPDVLLSE